MERDEKDFESPQGERQGEQERFSHVSVLLQEAIDFLAIRRGGVYIDLTLGLGGHSHAIASRLGPKGHLIGFDKDTRALELARQRLRAPAGQEKDWPRVTLLHASFAELAQRVPPASADGVLADLGVSSMQFDDAARGFSFRAEAPLDMRMDPHGEMTAHQVVNHMDEEELANVIYEFGEERRSRRIARAIVRARPVRSTAHLAQVISAVAPPMKSERIHPATRTFQALRIFVNRELDDLQTLLTGKPAGPDEMPGAALRVLKTQGRLVIISFHSLEDRIVKDAFRDAAKQEWVEILTRKPMTAAEEEVGRNPRARSAKLRAAKRI